MNRDEIRECMEQVHISGEMQQELIRSIHRQMEGGKRRSSLGRMAAMAASSILLVGILAVSAQAAISNFVGERMENIPSEELEDLVEIIRQQEVECDSYSRGYSETEEMRMRELREAYRGGRFPEEKLLQVEYMEQAPEDALSYARDVSCFCLPNREMTEEELLEIIDLEHTMAYAVSQSPQAQEAGAEQETRRQEVQGQDPEAQQREHESQQQEYDARQQELWERVQAADGISESEAVEIAREYLETAPDLSAEGAELLRAGLLEITDFERSAEIGIAYSVTFNYPGAHSFSFLIIDAVNGQILSVNGN